MPEVSVIIPTYNRSSLVRESVASVLRQSFTDFEVIVVDDGSTDDTSVLIKGISDSRIRYFYKENGGVATARNLGMAHAQGEYFAFLESDDIWPGDFLSIMVFHLRDNAEYGGAYSLFKDRYPDGREIVGFNKDRYLSGNLTRKFFERTPFIVPSATLFRRCVWENFWWDEALRACDDIDAFLRISVRTKILCVPDVCIIRQITSDSLTRMGEETLSPTATLIFERFYLHLNGQKYVPFLTARHRISRTYRGLAKQHHKAGNRRAAILLLKKAIRYYPIDFKNYRRLLKALLLSKRSDKMTNWQMPEALPPYITVTQNK